MSYEVKDDDEDDFRESGEAKHRTPIEGACPKCGRCRLVRGDDQKCRCTDCAWCVEDNAYDDQFARYLFT
jgi:ribosomal protein L37AE/L43A